MTQYAYGSIHFINNVVITLIRFQKEPDKVRLFCHLLSVLSESCCLTRWCSFHDLFVLQKSRESFQLSNLRPYREPLCSGIGTNKMEVVVSWREGGREGGGLASDRRERHQQDGGGRRASF